MVILQKLAEGNPAVTRYQIQLSNAYNTIGVLHVGNGRLTEALAAFRKALPLRQKLTDDYPTVTDFQKQLSQILNNIGYLLVKTGRPDEALADYRNALNIIQKLAAANPGDNQIQRDLAGYGSNLGRLLAREKQFVDAFKKLDASLAIRKKLTETDPQSTDFATDLGESFAYRGWARFRAGQTSEAADDLRRATELWDKIPVLDIETRFERCRVLALLARLGAEAKSQTAAAEARAFADRAMAALEVAVKAGWSDLHELEGLEFNALRNRDDFQKLVKELEKKQAADPSRRP
jgi:tetratricopeptide (TPR) repeat protein